MATENEHEVELSEIEVTPDEIRKYMAENGVKSVTAKRVMEIVNRFGVDAFASGNNAAWNEMFHKVRPGTSVDLAGKSVKTFWKVATWIKDQRFQNKTRILEKQKEAEKAAKDAEKAEKARKDHERLLNPVFTVEELSGLVTLMLDCHFDAVDLRGARGFLDTFKVFPKPGAPAEKDGK